MLTCMLRGMGPWRNMHVHLGGREVGSGHSHTHPPPFPSPHSCLWTLVLPLHAKPTHGHCNSTQKTGQLLLTQKPAWTPSLLQTYPQPPKATFLTTFLHFPAWASKSCPIQLESLLPVSSLRAGIPSGLTVLSMFMLSTPSSVADTHACPTPRAQFQLTLKR